MSISFLLVTLALSNIQYDVLVQPGFFMNDMAVSSAGVSLAASGNPWAAPVLPDADYSRDSNQGSRHTGPATTNRPRYISPEELESLEKVPGENKPYSQNWEPLNMNGLLRGRRYGAPLYGPGSFGQGGYLPGAYGSPAYPGLDPLLGPYGGQPYGNVPYQGLLPFIY